MELETNLEQALTNLCSKYPEHIKAKIGSYYNRKPNKLTKLSHSEIECINSSCFIKEEFSSKIRNNASFVKIISDYAESRISNYFERTKAVSIIRNSEKENAAKKLIIKAEQKKLQILKNANQAKQAEKQKFKKN